MPYNCPSVALKPAKYEHSDVSGKLVAILAFGLGTSIVSVTFLLGGLYSSARDVSVPQRLPSLGEGAQLQIDEATDLSSQRRAEDERLQSYGWINRNEKRIRIPIERAMDLITQRGLRDWSKP